MNWPAEYQKTKNRTSQLYFKNSRRAWASRQQDVALAANLGLASCGSTYLLVSPTAGVDKADQPGGGAKNPLSAEAQGFDYSFSTQVSRPGGRIESGDQWTRMSWTGSILGKIADRRRCFFGQFVFAFSRWRCRNRLCVLLRT